VAGWAAKTPVLVKYMPTKKPITKPANNPSSKSVLSGNPIPQTILRFLAKKLFHDFYLKP
jgi:hypothetical protein